MSDTFTHQQQAASGPGSWVLGDIELCAGVCGVRLVMVMVLFDWANIYMD